MHQHVFRFYPRRQYYEKVRLPPVLYIEGKTVIVGIATETNTALSVTAFQPETTFLPFYNRELIETELLNR